jgi:hypothetical protein
LSGFYEEKPERTLRFGDVIVGFQVVIPQIHKPTINVSCSWGISISQPSYFVIMTPCCSIEKKCFNLAPLSHIRPSFLSNKYFREDLTRINRKVLPELSVSTELWNDPKFQPRREKLLAEGEAYTNKELFIYAPHDLLAKYTLDYKPPVEMHYYMIDFKTIYKIDCNQIDRDKDPPAEIKLLQLTVQTREELRRKLSLYYGQIPEEDLL